LSNPCKTSLIFNALKRNLSITTNRGERSHVFFFLPFQFVVVILTGKMTGNLPSGSNNKDMKEELELPFFNMDEMASATNNFSDANKLGEGGFGPVYKVIIICKPSCNMSHGL